MKSVSGKELARVLEAHGWECKRVRGSHHVYVKEGCSVRLSLPIHGNSALKPGLLSFFLKTAGISEDEL